jgi:flagellar basal body P-ring formation protein FlgA
MAVIHAFEIFSAIIRNEFWQIFFSFLRTAMVKNRWVWVISLLAVTIPAQCEDKFQALDAIYAVVKEAIENNMHSSSEYEINVLPLDSQLKLAECTQPLEVVKNANMVKAGRVTIGVHCGGVKKWSVFVSAIIKVYESVIVLTRPVQRGEIIAHEYLSLERMDVSNTRGDFVTDFSQVENKEAARNLPSGAILGLKSIAEPPLVRRKDKVIISSGVSGFSVQMSGTALMDGVKGQVIRVKNESSGRIVSGTVIEAGMVLVK